MGGSSYIIKQKSPDFSVETTSAFFPLIIKRWFRSCDLHTRSLTNRFVCNFLSSSASLNLCSCFFWLTLALRFRFRLILGRPFHGLSPLPFRFLTSAVFAFFRPLQFWILTTQPLFLLFPFLPASASQWLSQCSVSAFASSVFPVLFLPGFPCILSRFRYSAFLYVSFRPSLIRSHSCSSGAYFRLSLSVFSASRPLSFVRFFSASGYWAFCFFLSVLPVSASQWHPRCCLSAFASWLSPFSPAWFPVHSFPVSILGFLMVSFRPSLLRSRSCSTGDPLSDLSSGVDA